MPKKVFITPEGIIEILVAGDQTVSSVRALGEEASRLATSQRASGQPVVILDNLFDIGTVPPEARRLVVDFIKNTDYERFAMVGTNAMLRFGANLMFTASGKANRLKFF